MYLAEVKAVALAVISSGYHSQALLYRTQTNAILGDTVYAIPRSAISVLGMSIRESLGSSPDFCVYAYHGCTRRRVVFFEYL